MTEEIYKNEDTYYIKTLLCEIKMFDKDDNEINWTPTQNLGDKVIFYNQAYINEQTKRLELENERIYNDGQTEITRLCNENNKLISALEEIREIAQGMHDWWINKSSYENTDKLADHLLITELNRILYLFDEEVEE